MPEPPDNNGSERELRPATIYRKVTGGFRPNWGDDLFAAIRPVVGTVARQGINVFHAIRAVLDGDPIIIVSRQSEIEKRFCLSRNTFCRIERKHSTNEAYTLFAREPDFQFAETAECWV